MATATTDASRHRGDRATEKDKERREKDLDFERSVYVSVLLEKDLEELLGSEWKSRPPTKVNLNGNRFKLETLKGPGGADAAGGLLNPALKKNVLTHLDVSDNRLHDISCVSKTNGFESLTCLLARRNLIGAVELDLPKLVELNLSYNQLRQLPPMSKMPHLEILVLAHNQLSGSVEGLKDSIRIKHLDLSHNQFDMNPSQLAKALEHLARLRNLTSLRLYGNPFVACFKEYQVFVVKALPSVTALDDVDMSSMKDTLRYDIRDAETLIKDLTLYDEPYRKRKEQEKHEKLENRDEGAGAAFAGEGGLPRLRTIVNKLEEILEDATLLQKNVAFALSIAKKRGLRSKAFREMGEHLFWEDLGQDECNEEDGKVKRKFGPSDREMEAAVSRTLELIMLVMERHDSVRPMIIEMLGWLTSAVKYKLGLKCMHRLSRLLMSNEQDKREVLHTIQKVVVPCLEVLSEQEGLAGMQTKEMVVGVTSLLECKDHKKDVAKVLQRVIPLFLDWLIKTEKSQDLQEGAHIVHALACLTDDKDNCLQVASLEVSMKCIGAINNQSYALSDKYCDLWLNFLHLAGNLMVNGANEEIIKRFKEESVHVNVISRGRAVISAAGGGGTEWAILPIQAKTIARVCHFLAIMMTAQEQVLIDCCTSYHMKDFLCDLLKNYSDPLVLAEGCRCLMVILTNPKIYREQGKQVVEDLGKLVPFLMFLGGGKYQEVYSYAVQQRGVEPPPLPQLDNELVCDAFCAIIDLFHFFSKDASGDELREMVANCLNNEERDQKLLRLLVVKNDDVRLGVMKCISQVSVKEIASEEMGMLIKCLSDTRNIEQGNTEDVLALVIGLLEKLVEAEVPEGAKFRKNYAEMAIAEAFLVLYQNARRETYDQEEEEEKLNLSCAIVSFLRACSRRSALRANFKNPRIEEQFTEIMKWEEDFHRPYARDVALEQTWMGRSLNTLLKCLQEPNALHRSKKVVFRVLSRMADISEGQPEGMHGKRAAFSLQELAQRECRMWRKRAIEKYHHYLDEDELEDRDLEASTFIQRMESILHHLMSHEDRMEEREYHARMQKDLRWFDDVRDEGRRIENDIVEEQKKKKTSDKVTEVDLSDDDDSNEDDDLPGEQLLMRAVFQFEDFVESGSGQLFTVRPEQFTYDEQDLLVNDENGGRLPEKSSNKVNYKLNKAYTVCAFLRILHAIILVPPEEDCRTQMVAELMKRDIVAKLVALLETVPCLNCNAAAKFLRIMTLVVNIGFTGQSHKGLGLDVLSLLSNYVQRIADGMLFLLKLTKDKCLDLREQTLCAEIASFMTVVMKAVPVLTANWSTNEDAQQQNITKCVDYLVPAVTIRLIIAMIIYDLQMDLGGGDRKRIQKQFVQQAYDKVGMKDNASQCLVQLLVRCPHLKYNVLEVFSVAEVFNQQSVRPCFMAELLNDVSMFQYQLFIQGFLRKQSEEPNLRVIVSRRVEAPDALGGMVLRILCLTTRNIYLLAPPDQRPLYAHQDTLGGRWQPSWEAVFPRPPVVIWKKSYSDIKSLYKIYGTQILAIEWKPKDASLEKASVTGANGNGSRPQAPGRSSNAAGKTRIKDKEDRANSRCGIAAPTAKLPAEKDAQSTEQKDIEVFIFQRVSARDRSVDLLLKYSGEKMDQRAKVVIDLGVRQEVLEHEEVRDPTGETVLAVSVALAAPPTSLLDFGGVLARPKGQREPQLFVLTKKKVLMFSMSLTSWRPPANTSQTGDNPDTEGFRPRDLDEGQEDLRTSVAGAAQATQGGHTPALASAGRLERGASGSEKAQSTQVLKCIRAGKVPPKEVMFRTSPEADLVIKVDSSDPFEIRFYDDSAREHWRRALAYILMTTGKDWTRDMPVAS